MEGCEKKKFQALRAGHLTYLTFTFVLAPLPLTNADVSSRQILGSVDDINRLDVLACRLSTTGSLDILQDF